MRVYGTNHNIKNIQLVNNANVLLDDKKGRSYVVAKDITVDNVYYENVKTPVTNKGINCKVTDVIKGMKITKEMLLNESIVPIPPIPPTPEIEIEIIPKIVYNKKKYKLNKDLTKEQLKDLLN
jgi:hypothetical protein